MAVQINPRTSRAWCVKAALIVTCWVACFYGTFFGLQSFAVHPLPPSDECHLHHEHVICSQGIRCCGWQQKSTAGALQAARLLGHCSAAQGLVTAAVLRHRPLPLQALALSAYMLWLCTAAGLPYATIAEHFALQLACHVCADMGGVRRDAGTRHAAVMHVTARSSAI